MAERVAEIEVYAGLEDRDLIAGLRRAEAEVEKTARKISSERAEATIGADLTELKRDLKAAKAELDKFAKRKKDMTLTADERRYAAQQAQHAQNLLDNLRRREAAEKKRLAVLRSENAELERQSRLKIAQAKRDEIHGKLLATQEKRRADAAAALAKQQAKAESDRLKAVEALAKAEAKAYEMDAAFEQKRRKNIEDRQKMEARAYAMDAAFNEKRKRDAESLRKMEARAYAMDAAFNEKRRKDVENLQKMEAKAHSMNEAWNAKRLTEVQRLEAANEKAAIQRQKAIEKEHYETTVGLARQDLQVAKLQRRYAKLTEQAEKVGKRRAFTVEGIAKLEVDRAAVHSEMEAVKTELNYLGSHPPVGIQVEIDRRRSMNPLRRAAAEFGDIFRVIAEKASNLGQVSVRVGPFTTSLKGLAIAVGFLGPILTDLLGTAGALIGVLGTGLAGATAVGTAGLIGLAAGFGGIKMALKSSTDDYKLAKQATDAYQKAVAKHGKSSKEAKNAQEQMNSVLKSVTPLARAAAKGSSEFRAGWEKATQPTQKSFTNITKGFFGAMKSITPMWAKSTNNLSATLDKSMRGGFKFLKGREFKRNFEGITDNFNKALPSFMRALGSMGRGLLNLGREGSKFLKPLGDAMGRTADKFLKFTQRDDFGKTVKRWAKHAGDLGKFFAALGRVMMHFFGAGADAGDRLVVSMTEALNRWDRFLTSAGGRQVVAEHFERAVSGAQSLWGALAPLISGFVVWANNMSPIVASFMEGVAWAMKLVKAMTTFIGMNGPIAALAVTLGAVWAVSKIGAFVAMLARIPIILRTIAAQQGILAAVGSIFSGRLASGLRQGAGVSGAIAQGGTAAAASMRAGVAAGGVAAAASIRGAMVAGGIAGAAAARGPGALVGARGAVGPGAFVGSGAGAPGAAKAAGNLSKMAKAGNLAKGALAGLGAITLGVASPVAGLATAAIAAAGATYLLANRTRGWQKDAKSAAAGLKTYNGMLKASQANSTDLASATLMLHDSKSQVKSMTKQSAQEERELAKMRSQGKQGTNEYSEAMTRHKQTLLGIQGARLNEISTSRNRNKLYKDEKEHIENTTKVADTAVKKAREAVREQAKGDGLLDKVLKHATLPGMIAALKNKGKLSKDAAAAVRTLAQAEAVASRKHADSAVNVANLSRAMRGLVPLARSAGKALATVTREGGKKLATTISLKFQDPGQAQRVAASTARSLRQGVPKTVATRIIADSKNAEEAIRRLQAARLDDKKLNIIQKGGPQALAMLEKIIGRKLTKKEQQIGQEGGPRVLDMLRRILNRDLVPKFLNIEQRGGDRVLSMLQAINNTQLSNKSFTTTEFRRVVGGGGSKITKKPPVPLGGADGFGAQPNRNQILRAMETAELSGPRRTRGGRYSQPTLLVGEENRSEIVVSTNPKYRKRNRDYLREAANALGMVATPVEAAAPGKGPRKRPSRGANPTRPRIGARPKPKDTVGAGGFGSFDGAAFSPDAVISRDRVFKPTKRKKSKIKSNRGWATYIEGLQTQQGYWEREVSIRESQVKEPENMVVRDPSKDVEIVDPVTKEKTKVEAYKANPEIENSYKPALQHVMNAMKELIAIVAELVRAIPHALKANQAERGARENSVDRLESRLRESNSAAKKTKNDKRRQKHERESDRLREKRDAELAEIQTLKEDEAALKASRVDAGFDYREANIAMGKVRNEYDTVHRDATTEAAQQSLPPEPSTGGGGGGGGGGAPIGIGEQTALALQQNAQTLAAFGSNFISGGGPGGAGPAQFRAGDVGGPGMGWEGMQANPASSGPGWSGGGGRSAVRSSSGAATFMTSSGRRGGSGTMGGMEDTTGGGDTNVVVNNNFAAPPPDPHTWSKGVEYELGSTV